MFVLFYLLVNNNDYNGFFIFVTLLFHKNKQNPTNNNVFSLFIFISTCRLRQQDVNE